MTTVRAVLLPVLLAALAACVAAPGNEGSSLEHHRAESALGPYSAAVCTGDLCVLSGKIGERGGTFEEEVHSALSALEAELTRVGSSPAELVSVTVYLTDMDLYAQFNAVYAERLPEPFPARACVAVAALPAGARVELQAVAHRRR